MQERRRAPVERRRGRRVPFVAAVAQKVGANVELALAQNLGPTGIELKRAAGSAYLPRTPVSLSFELPDGGASFNSARAYSSSVSGIARL
jgi:hypothetical protein